MNRLKINASSPSVKVDKSRDETGHSYVRYYTNMPGPIFPVSAESIRQSDLDVMFQKIIHDGLIGNSFLKRFTVTYDLPHSQMIFSQP